MCNSVKQSPPAAAIRHSSIRDITAELLTEVWPNVDIEPTLQPLNGEAFNHRTANTEDNARLDSFLLQAQVTFGSDVTDLENGEYARVHVLCSNRSWKALEFNGLRKRLINYL